MDNTPRWTLKCSNIMLGIVIGVAVLECLVIVRFALNGAHYAAEAKYYSDIFHENVMSCPGLFKYLQVQDVKT